MKWAITATVDTTNVSYIRYNSETRQLETASTYRTFKEQKTEKAKVAEIRKTDFNAVAIESENPVSGICYGMTVEQFKKYAKIGTYDRNALNRKVKGGYNVVYTYIDLTHADKGIQESQPESMSESFGKLNDEKKFSAIREKFETETLKVLTLKSCIRYNVENQYMVLQIADLINHGVVLDEKTRKEAEQEIQEEEQEVE